MVFLCVTAVLLVCLGDMAALTSPTGNNSSCSGNKKYNILVRIIVPGFYKCASLKVTHLCLAKREHSHVNLIQIETKQSTILRPSVTFNFKGN